MKNSDLKSSIFNYLQNRKSTLNNIIKTHKIPSVLSPSQKAKARNTIMTANSILKNRNQPKFLSQKKFSTSFYSPINTTLASLSPKDNYLFNKNNFSLRRNTNKVKDFNHSNSISDYNYKKSYSNKPDSANQFIYEETNESDNNNNNENKDKAILFDSNLEKEFEIKQLIKKKKSLQEKNKKLKKKLNITLKNNKEKEKTIIIEENNRKEIIKNITYSAFNNKKKKEVTLKNLLLKLMEIKFEYENYSLLNSFFDNVLELFLLSGFLEENSNEYKLINDNSENIILCVEQLIEEENKLKKDKNLDDKIRNNMKKYYDFGNNLIDELRLDDFEEVEKYLFNKYNYYNENNNGIDNNYKYINHRATYGNLLSKNNKKFKNNINKNLRINVGGHFRNNSNFKRSLYTYTYNQSKIHEYFKINNNHSHSSNKLNEKENNINYNNTHSINNNMQDFFISFGSNKLNINKNNMTKNNYDYLGSKYNTSQQNDKKLVKFPSQLTKRKSLFDNKEIKKINYINTSTNDENSIRNSNEINQLHNSIEIKSINRNNNSDFDKKIFKKKKVIINLRNKRLINDNDSIRTTITYKNFIRSKRRLLNLKNITMNK